MTREEAVIILDGFKNNPLFNDTHLQAFNMAISALSEIKSEWIPVSERLPDETKTKGHGLCHVLVTHTYAGIIRTHQAVFTQGKFLKLETYKEDNTVVAWMPLPEPYKESDTK